MPSLEVSPGVLDITTVRGDDVDIQVTITEDEAPADLTGRTFVAQLRLDSEAGSPIPITVVNDAPVTGVLRLQLAAAATDDLLDAFVWDLEQTIGGKKRTILAGSWTFTADVTKP